MQIDQVLIGKLIDIIKSVSVLFNLHFENKIYPLSDVVIKKSPSVNKSSSADSILENHSVVKISAATFDSSLVPMLSKTMLGPNTEFAELVLKTSVKLNGTTKKITLFTNLTSRMQTGRKMILNMIVTGTESK